MRTSITLAAAAIFTFFTLGTAQAADPCLECHERETPGIVKYWKDSRHFTENIACADCHGTDEEENHEGRVRVEAARCAPCHESAYNSHSLSKHGIGLKAGRGCTRNIPEAAHDKSSCTFCHERNSAAPIAAADCAMFLAQSPEMRRQGCDACHVVEVRCDTCHTKHGTDLVLAGRPGTCGVCHMGPDHAQLEMWETSIHGVIWEAQGPEAAPSCTTCHMLKGTHNVSKGIAHGLPEGAEELKKAQRDTMLGICAKCHTRALAERNLSDADKIEQQSRALVQEAQEIIEALNSEGLLEPAPAQRPRHPLFGTGFVIGPHMLYENLSAVESEFFRMKQFHYMSAFKGAYHQNPDYTHWFGNAPLKLSLSEIKGRAALLRKTEKLKKRLDNLGGMLRDAAPGKTTEGGNIKNELRRLRERNLSGEISEEQYRKLKKEALERSGL